MTLMKRTISKKLFDILEEQMERREEYVRIMKEALEDDTTSRLMKTPLQATIISILVKSGGKPPHGLRFVRVQKTSKVVN